MSGSKSEAVGILKADGVPDHGEFEAILQNAVTPTATPCVIDFFEFLSLARPQIDFARLHQLPTHAASCLQKGMFFPLFNLRWK